MIEIDMRDAMKRITVQVEIKREKETRFRVWLATLLISIANRVAHFNIEIVEEFESEQALNWRMSDIDQECLDCKNKG